MIPVRALSHRPLARARAWTWILLMRLTIRLRRRGYYRVCGWARHYGDRVAARVAPDTELIVPLGDIYWNSLLETAYEPEVAVALARHLNKDTHFIDCGANVGYWSMIARHHSASVVAVEASPRTFQRLEENAALNQADPARVVLLNRAVWSDSGHPLSIREHEVHHAAASVTGETAGFDSKDWSQSLVDSISITDIVHDYLPADGSPVIVKLDVEGAESEALDGAEAVAGSRPILFVYEDHGSDRDCVVTRHLQDLGYRTAGLVDGKPMEVADVLRVKTDPRVGYNFAAYKPGGWEWNGAGGKA